MSSAPKTDDGQLDESYRVTSIEQAHALCIYAENILLELIGGASVHMFTAPLTVTQVDEMEERHTKNFRGVLKDDMYQRLGPEVSLGRPEYIQKIALVGNQATMTVEGNDPDEVQAVTKTLGEAHNTIDRLINEVRRLNGLNQFLLTSTPSQLPAVDDSK